MADLPARSERGQRDVVNKTAGHAAGSPSPSSPCRGLLRPCQRQLLPHKRPSRRSQLSLCPSASSSSSVESCANVRFGQAAVSRRLHRVNIREGIASSDLVLPFSLPPPPEESRPETARTVDVWRKGSYHSRLAVPGPSSRISARYWIGLSVTVSLRVTRDTFSTKSRSLPSPPSPSPVVGRLVDVRRG